ncbi:MAG: zinc ribbon domain-containing protein [Deltaproteobacteria bacterium]|nr:zinc ribbon domain-containing protein [Deltaproteobacteria bacterium]
MGKIHCPGQDTAFWRPGDIFELACTDCGTVIEFFKDDATRRCPGCGRKVANPKLNLGCAQWCEHAKECLGYDPKEAAEMAGGPEESLRERLLEAVGRRDGAPARERAARVLALAQELMKGERAAPRVVLAAAILAGATPETAAAALEEAGVKADTQDEVQEVLNGLRQSGVAASPELAVVWDADRLVSLEDLGPGSARRAAGLLKTASGRAVWQERLATA